MAAELVPDDKDWTWVLERPCPECGFDARSVDARTVGSMIRSNALRWAEVFDRSADELGRRPTPDRWSPLEYGAHVRDVFGLYLQRLRLMLDTDDPLYPNWDQDATAVAERYGEQDPVAVVTELRAAASALADAFDNVPEGSWTRTGRRSDGAAFTVESFAVYLIHDPVHHLWDVTGIRAG